MPLEKFITVSVPDGKITIHCLSTGGYIKIRISDGPMGYFSGYPNVCTIRGQWLPFLIQKLSDLQNSSEDGK